jgi:hypothetical protein
MYVDLFDSKVSIRTLTFLSKGSTRPKRLEAGLVWCWSGRGAAAGHGRQKMRMSRTKSTFTSRPQNCRSKTVGQPKQPKIYRMSRTKYTFVSHPQNCRSKTIKKGRSAKQNSGCLARNTHLYRECRTVVQKRSGSRKSIGCLARNTHLHRVGNNPPCKNGWAAKKTKDVSHEIYIYIASAELSIKTMRLNNCRTVDQKRLGSPKN